MILICFNCGPARAPHSTHAEISKRRRKHEAEGIESMNIKKKENKTAVVAYLLSTLVCDAEGGEEMIVMRARERSSRFSSKYK